MRLKHLIIGAGVIGRATGTYLETHGQMVCYNDCNADVILKLKKDGKHVDLNSRNKYDLYWICTAEWNVEDVINVIKDIDPKIVIRSTIRPHEVEYYEGRYGVSIAHIPEFLKEKTAVDDVFNSDRIVIGSNNEDMSLLLKMFFLECFEEKVFICSPEESSLVKLIANAWLSLQISFWNEMKKLCDVVGDVDRQRVADMVTCDRRISKYGSIMLGKPFGGFCFPKDTRSLSEVFKDNGISENIISALIKTNEELL